MKESDQQAYDDLLAALPTLEPKGRTWVLRERHGVGDMSCRIVDVTGASGTIVAQADNWRTLAKMFQV